MKTLGFFLAVAMACMTMQAQTPQALPMAPEVRYGQLENGLTYYIQRNELPEHQAEFYIAQRVGSVLEEETQRGLAHFLEHMAFNGTKNFPGKAMLDYLERHGVKFGTNVNAYTSIDETVYNISAVPTDSTAHPHIIDSCLLMLHDWSGYITLDGEEIDKERGVIHEEWRSRNSANLRMIENDVLPKLMPGTRYAERMPIGLMSVVDSFTHEELRNYYHKWYRPDLQAVIVVGDINVDTIEARIRTLWQDIQTPANAAQRVYFEVPGNEEPLLCVSTDKEFPHNELTVFYKRPRMPKEVSLSMSGYFVNIMQNAIQSAINNRLNEIAQKADAPFQGASAYFNYYLYAHTLESFTFDVNVKPGMWKEGLNAVASVVKSVQQYGITQAELDRFMSNAKSGMEKTYNEREKRKNASIVAEIKRHFLSDEAMPGIEMEWTQLFPMIEQYMTLDVINKACKGLVSEKDFAILFMGKQADDNVVPTEAEMLAAYKEAMAQPVEAYAEETIDAKLIAKLPKPGKVKKVEEGPFGSKVWTLSNGVKVVWKQTDFKKDEISLTAVSEGGYQTTMQTSRVNRQNMTTCYDIGGIGAFSPMDLRKVLAGKNASVDVGIGQTREYINGSCAVKDFRTMFELLYLNVTAPRVDKELYQAWFNRAEQQMKNQQGTPNKIINDSSYLTFYKGVEEMRPMGLEELQQLDYETSHRLAKERFANMADFTFFLIGNIDEDSLRVMCQQYLATLPANKSREPYKAGSMITPGSRENRFNVPMEQPNTQVVNQWTLYNQKWNLKDDIAVDILGQVLRMIFTETIRENEGGVYSPGASASYDALDNYMNLTYYFVTGEEKLAHIEEVAFAETQKVAQPGGVSAERFNKVRDYLLKRYEQNQKENGYWMGQIRHQYIYSYNRHDNYLEILNALTPADIEAMAARILKGDRIQFVANGVEKK